MEPVQILLAGKDRASALICAQTLQKIFYNIIAEPSEPKFRSIKRSNAAISSRVLSVPGGPQLLVAFGFNSGGDVMVVDGPFNEAIAAQVTEAIAQIQDEEAAKVAAERKAELAAGAKKREEAALERERLTAAAKRDQAERKSREADSPLKASQAQERKFGAEAHRVDLKPRAGG